MKIATSTFCDHYPYEIARIQRISISAILAILAILAIFPVLAISAILGNFAVIFALCTLMLTGKQVSKISTVERSEALHPRSALSGNLLYTNSLYELRKTWAYGNSVALPRYVESY